MELKYNDLFEKQNYMGETIPDFIENRRVFFELPDRQRILGHINRIYRGNPEMKREVISKCLKYSGYEVRKLQDFLNIFLNTDENQILKTLCSYHVDVNDFGIPLDTKGIKKLKLQDTRVKNGLKIVDSDTLLKDNEGYKPEFIIEPFVKVNGVNILGAERGTGKTRFCIELAQCVIRSMHDFLGYPVKFSGNVLYINLEMPSSDFSTIIRQIEAHYELLQAKVGILYTLSSKDYPTYKIDDFIKNIHEAKPVLVIIDSFKAFINRMMVENNQKTLDNTSIMKFFDFIDKASRDKRITFLITNHTNKGTRGMKAHSDLFYGPGALMDFADHTFLLRKTNEPGKMLIIPDKTRFFKEGVYGINLIGMADDTATESVFLKLLAQDVNEDEYMPQSPVKGQYSESIKERALGLDKQGKSAREIGMELGIYHATISRWIKAAA